MTLGLAAVAAAGLAAAATLARALTVGGGVAAWAVGTAVLAGTGWAGGAVLLAFFVTGSAIGRLVGRPTPLDAKGERRDPWQVLANGGVAAAVALVGLADGPLGLWLLTATLAAASADTWATAWGSGSRVPPRLILTGAPVPAGTSGGITWRGSLGAIAGAAVVSVTGALVVGRPAIALWGTVLGVAGMLADSAIGAAWQARFYCGTCDAPSEWPRHRCGAATVQTGGVGWIMNDAVNALATATAAAAAFVLARLGGV